MNADRNDAGEVDSQQSAASPTRDGAADSGSDTDSSSESGTEDSSETSSTLDEFVQEFDNVEQEIEFYQSKISTLREEDSSKPRLLEALLMLGAAYATADQNSNAEKALLEVRGEMETVWGWPHLGSQMCIATLVRVYESLGKHEEAYELYDTAITGVCGSLGREYPWTIELLSNYACLCARNSDVRKAAALFDSVYKAKQHVFGQDHKSTLNTLCNLCRLAPADNKGQYEDDLLHALGRLKSKYGDENTNVLRTMKHLATTRVETGISEETREFWERLGNDAIQNEECCSLHADEHIPQISTRPRPESIDDKPIESLRTVLDNLPLVLGKGVLLTLEWTRGFIWKWTGMDLSTFTDYLESDHITAWSRIIDPAVLLEEACAIGHVDAVQALLAKRSDGDSDDETTKPDIQRAFRRGVTSGNKLVVELLLDLDININDTNDSGRSALHDAAEGGHAVVTSLLLDHGADTTCSDENCDTPIDLALKEDHEVVVRLLMSHTGAILANSMSCAKPSSIPKRRTYTCETEQDTGLMATILHFYVNQPTSKEALLLPGCFADEEHRVQVKPVEHLVLNWKGAFDDMIRDSAGYENLPAADFQWIHLPANNMDWVEALMDTISSRSSEGHSLSGVLRDEYWKNQLHDPVYTTVHGRFMKPMCRALPGCPPKSGCLVAYMPYVHWEAEDARVDMSKVVKNIVSNQQLGVERLSQAFKKKIRRRLRKRAAADDPNKALLEYYLFPTSSRSPLHVRRTLDQYQYYMTDNTDDRDSDQVITRYFQRRHQGVKVPIMMVDQLWLWILDNKTIVTSFPQRWGGQQNKNPAGGMILDTRNVLDSILSRLKQKDRSPVTSVFDLAELIMAQCLGLNVDRIEWEHERYPYLEIFDYSVNYVTNEEVRCFNDFANSSKRRTHLSHQEQEDQKAKKKKEKKEKEEEAKRKKKSGKKDPGEKIVSVGHVVKLIEETSRTLKKSPKPKPEDLFDISHEIELMREIKDIQEELNILRNLFSQQEVVLKSFTQILEEAKATSNGSTPSSGSNHVNTTASTVPTLANAIKRHIAYVDQIETNTHRPYHHLEDLLDLKQKQSNVFEARMTRASGNTITVFTIVTIIFLPASFMAAFFALPIEQYPLVGENSDRMDLGYAIKYTVIPTVAIAIPFIVFALLVNPILSIMKLIIKPFKRMSIMVYTAAPWTVFFALFFAKVSWRMMKHIRKVLSVLWSCLVVASKMVLIVILLPRHWRRIYGWMKDLRTAKREDKEQGIERRNRQYVTRYFLRAVKEKREEKRKERDLDERDIEEQRVGSFTESSCNSDDPSGRRRSIRRDNEQSGNEGGEMPPSTVATKPGSASITRSDKGKGVAQEKK